MIRKTLFVVGGLGALSVVFFGRDAFSYIWTSVARVKDSVRSSVPLEFEIDRARKLVHNLEPDIRRNMHVIAKEEVEVERLENQIADMDTKIDQQRNDLVRLRGDLAQDKNSYHYAGRHYSTTQVKVDLANRFERFKTNQATLESLRDIHAARERSLAAARQKLEGMLAAKQQLTVDVENLEARLKMIEVAQTTSDYNFDDSQLARAKDLMTDIRTRLSVAEKLVNSDHQFQGEIQLEGPAPDDILDQVTEYLELSAEDEEQVAAY